MRWVIWASVAVPYLLAFFQRLALNSASDPIRATFHWNAAQLGMVAAAYFVAASVMRVPSGIIADRWGARRMLLVSMLLGAVGALLFSQARSLPVAIAARVLVALGDSAIFIGLVRLQADWFKHEEFATVSGLSLVMAGVGFWLSTTPLVLALRVASWQAVFAVVGGLGLVLTAAAALIIPEKADTPRHDVSHARIPLTQRVTRIVANPYSWPSIALFMAGYSIWTVFGATWGIPYWNQVQHLSMRAAAERFSLFVAAWAIGCWILGRLSDRWRERRRLQVIAGGIAVLGMAMLAAVPQLPSAWALAVFVAMGSAAGVTPISYASMRENNPPDSPGLAIAVMLTVSDLAAAGAQYLSGRLLDVSGALHGHDGTVSYSAQDYSRVWWLLVGWGVIWLLAGLATRETHAKNLWSAQASQPATRLASEG